MSGKCGVVYTSYDLILPKEFRDTCKQNDDWYITTCPNCIEEIDYHKEKLYLSKSLDYAYCHRCNRVFLDKHLIFTNPNVRIPTSFSEYLDSIRCTDHLDSFKGMDAYFNASPCIDELGINYFTNIRRNPYLLKEYQEYGLRFDETGIYIPFIFEGVPRYYTKRLYEPKGDMKYFLPPIKSKPYYIIDRGSDKYVICEGVFDAIAIALINKTDNIIAIQGSTMTSAQMNSFRDRLPEYATIWLDDTDLSQKLADKIKSKICYCQVRTVNSDGADPEEMILSKLST